jgi:hypothetical protein
MEAELRNNLIKCAERFAAAEGYQMGRVGRMAAGDSTFFQRIHRNSFTVRTYDRTMLWFARNWPDDAEWPDDVPRPQSRRDAQEVA